MNTTHTHRADPKKQTFAGWHTCVSPVQCAANPQRQIAHGSLVYYDRCKCGAVRMSEYNAGRTNYGGWDDKGEYEA